MIQSPPGEPTTPILHVDVSLVSIADGIWQDMPDHIASFDEARLVTALTVEEAAAARGRGSLYILLDVSGEVEGRSEIERELIETIRREYAVRRGSVTFGLSEALRAANASLFDMNLSLGREARRMAGVAAAVLRGEDLYVAEAGPAVVYVEINGKLQRYPAESDWFTEDSPLISPQGTASVPLGVRREFACDLFHCSVAAGDVFVLANRALTQLAGPAEFAHAIANRGAEDIAGYFEEIANGADLSALVAELVDPRDLNPEADDQAQGEPEGELSTAEAAGTAAAAGLEPIDEGSEPEPLEVELEPEPVYASSTEPLAAAADQAQTEEAARAAEELARLRAERSARRRQQIGAAGQSAWRGIAAIFGVLLAILSAIARGLSRVFGIVDWQALGYRINRALNTFLIVVWRGLALTVRLALPGAPAKQSSLIPRRASKEPIWLRVVAVLLPLLLVGLAFAAYYQQGSRREDRAAELARQAEDKLNTARTLTAVDRPAAQKQLADALTLAKQARELSDTAKTRGTLYDIQDQLSATNGVAVLYFVANLAQVPGANITQIIEADTVVYLFDKANERILGYQINDTGTRSTPLGNQGVVLERGAQAGGLRVDTIRDMAWIDSTGGGRAGLVAVTGSAFLQYDSKGSAWTAFAVKDSDQWGAIRTAEGFMGNLYLLDSTRNQIWRYRGGASGLSPTSTPYLPANAPVDFSRATAMAIDSDVWVLMDDGQVLRFQGGQKQTFELGGLETPLKQPKAIFTRAGVDSLYIADSGNARIVQFDKNGRLVRQYRPRAQDGDAFDGLSALATNESKRKFYFTSGSAAYLANIP
ncbi:MAG: hypothetical protein ACM3JD_14250 [Rudaea sp.]